MLHWVSAAGNFIQTPIGGHLKGTILDFLRLAAEKPELAKDLVALAGKYDFQFSDEVSDEDLDGVSGGAVSNINNVHALCGAHALSQHFGGLERRWECQH